MGERWSSFEAAVYHAREEGYDVLFVAPEEAEQEAEKIFGYETEIGEDKAVIFMLADGKRAVAGVCFRSDNPESLMW